MSSQDIAAIVQAVASLVAVGATIWSARIAIEAQRRAEQFQRDAVEQARREAARQMRLPFEYAIQVLGRCRNEYSDDMIEDIYGRGYSPGDDARPAATPITDLTLQMIERLERQTLAPNTMLALRQARQAILEITAEREFVDPAHMRRIVKPRRQNVDRLIEVLKTELASISDPSMQG